MSTTTNILVSWDKDNEDYARFQDRILSYSARYKTFHDRKAEALKEIEQISIFKLAIENALPVRVL